MSPALARMPTLWNNHPNPDLDGTDSSGHSSSNSSSSSSSSGSGSGSGTKSNSNSQSNSGNPSTQSHPRRPNTMRDIREKKLRAKQEMIFTNTDPFSLSSPNRREQEYPVSPKSLPSRGADHGVMVEKEDEEVGARTDPKRAYQNHDDDDRSWPTCQETRSVAVADCSTTGASASLVDLGKEDFEGEAVTASVIAGNLTIAGLRSVKKTQDSDEERGRRGATNANVKAEILTINGVKTAGQTQDPQ